jgi:hypothetical protein
MKTLLLIAASTLLTAATVEKPQVEVQRISGEAPYCAVVRSGIMEYKDSDGKKFYVITGKTLQELVKQYGKE